jgi:hypothetical protein
LLAEVSLYSKRYLIYTKEEKPHDKTTSHKLGEVVVHCYATYSFVTSLLYKYTLYILSFIYLYLY